MFSYRIKSIYKKEFLETGLNISLVPIIFLFYNIRDEELNSKTEVWRRSGISFSWLGFYLDIGWTKRID